MSVPLDILIALQRNFPALRQVLDQPPGRINVTQWRRVAQRTGDPQVAYLLGALPDPPSRNDIIRLRHENPAIRRRRVAIASLMWGFGLGGALQRGWVSHISDFLTSPDLDDVLARCEEELAAGNIAGAYRLFTVPDRRGPEGLETERYRGIGFAYYTKILYFLARNALPADAAQYPLILDTKVSQALAQLSGYRLLVRPDSYRPRADSAAYACYVKTMHAWAASLNVQPEVIEYYLWREADHTGSPLWAACVTQHTRHWP
jgi:hypothetical protein